MGNRCKKIDLPHPKNFDEKKPDPGKNPDQKQ
jgi:hypothetical protein